MPPRKKQPATPRSPQSTDHSPSPANSSPPVPAKKRANAQPNQDRANTNGAVEQKKQYNNTLLDTTLPQVLVRIFSECQHSVANHRKNVRAVHKLFTQCAAITTAVEKGGGDKGGGGGGKKGRSLTGEKAFLEGIIDMLDRVLTVKKGVVQADRVIRFLGSFVEFGDQEAQKLAQKNNEDDEDTPISRLSSHLLRHLQKGFKAKNKNVRYRCAQSVGAVLRAVSSIDDDLHASLLASLLALSHDKESPVRVHAAIALARCQDPDDTIPNSLSSILGLVNEDEDDSDDDDEENNATKGLLESMMFDPSAETRRAALLNISKIPQTLPFVLSRTRDCDPNNRRAVYLAPLKELAYAAVPDANEGGDLGLRLTADQKEEIIRVGLRDREPKVKKEAKALVAGWIEDNGGDLVTFLESVDIIGSKVAEDALLSMFEARPDWGENLEFDEDFWENLTPESSFLARVYLNHLLRQNNEARQQECMPTISDLSDWLETRYTELVEIVSKVDSEMAEKARREEEEEGDEDEDDQGPSQEVVDDMIRKAFVTRELLNIANMEDYADEIGKRRMFLLIRNMVSHASLPHDLVPGCLDVLLKLSSGERDFMRIVVEIVQGLREEEDAVVTAAGERKGKKRSRRSTMASTMTGIDGDTQMGDYDDEDMEEEIPNAVKVGVAEVNMDKIEVHMRCLAIFRAMLERVQGALQDNSSLQGLLHELVVPSVRSKEADVRYQGLMCLGLVCLLDNRTAVESFGLFTHQSQAAEGELRIKVLQTVFDILMLHGLNFLAEKGHSPERVVDFLLHSLDQEMPEAQAVAVVGIAKLMLSGMISDDQVLQSLVLMYFSPETSDNQELRQCLSYFFPVYCFSSSANQRKMQRIFEPALEVLSSVYDDLEPDEKAEMIPPGQIALQLIDWTDPRKAVMSGPSTPADPSIQVDLCLGVIKGIYKETRKDERKSLCQLLGKMWIPDEIEDWKLRSVLLLISNLNLHRPLADSVARNAITRFENGLKKRFGDRAEGMDEDELKKADELQDTFQFLESVQEENNDNDTKSIKSSRLTRPRSRAKSAGPQQGKRPRKTAKEDTEEESPEEEESEVPQPKLRTRGVTKPKATPRKGKAKAKALESETEDEENEEKPEEDHDEVEPSEQAASEDSSEENVKAARTKWSSKSAAPKGKPSRSNSRKRG